MIQIIRQRVTTEQMEQMLEELKFYIKLAVDIDRRILAGGGEMQTELRIRFTKGW